MRLRDRIPDPNIFRIYYTSIALGLAYGIAVSLVAIFLDARGYAKETIGSLAACFALGIISLALPIGALIRRFSAKTTLTCSLAGYALSVGAFPFLDSFAALGAVRFVDGACSVGVWVSCETILLARSPGHQKAFVMSLYAIAMAFGYVGGPVLARSLSSVAPLPVAFVVASVVALCASGYVLLRLDRDDPSMHHESETHDGPRVSYWTVLTRIKTTCFATFAFGYFQSSVVLFLPLFLMESKGITREQTIIVPAFFALGMLLVSNLAGRLGDRYGHLVTIRALAVIGATMIASFVLLDSFSLMCGAVFVAGATLASISPVSLALQGVVTEPHNISRATAFYNAFYAAGMLLGPPLSSRIFSARGGGTMLYHLAAIWAAFIVFSVVFYRDDPASARRARSREQYATDPAS